MGVDLYEVRANAPRVSGWRQLVGSSGSSRVSLHAKTLIFDWRYLFVGSLNLDLRSVRLNNEIGLVIDSPALAQAMVQGLQQQLHGASYQVKLQNGHLL
jgi:cardiolipin synthase C